MTRPETEGEGNKPKLSAAELRSAIEILERPHADEFEVTDVPLWARIYTQPGLHPGLWAPLAVPLASLIGRVAWRRTEQREQAMHRARIFTGSDHEKELTAWAKPNLREYRMQDEIFWRPWLAPKMKIDGLEHLDRSRKRRGVILAPVHMGPMAHLQLALAIHLDDEDKRLWISRWRKLEEELHQSGPRAPYLPAKVDRLEAAGARFIGRGGSYPILRELLNRKEVCWLAIDTAARERGRVVPLAGRKTRLATGIAALARETNSPVLPLFASRDRWKPVAKILPPLQPRDFKTDEDLHDKLAEVATEMIEEHPTQAMPDLVTAMEWGAAGE